MPSKHESDRTWAMPYVYAIAAGVVFVLLLSLFGVWLHQ
jgi:hypothetical protein